MIFRPTNIRHKGRDYWRTLFFPCRDKIDFIGGWGGRNGGWGWKILWRAVGYMEWRGDTGRDRKN